MALCPRPSRARWAVSASRSAVCDDICCTTVAAGAGDLHLPSRSRPPKTNAVEYAANGMASGCSECGDRCCALCRQPAAVTVHGSSGCPMEQWSLPRAWALYPRSTEEVGRAAFAARRAWARAVRALLEQWFGWSSGRSYGPALPLTEWSGASKSVSCDRRRLGQPPVRSGGALQPHTVRLRYNREAVRRGSCVRDVCASRALWATLAQRVVFSSVVLFSSPVALFFGPFRHPLRPR